MLQTLIVYFLLIVVMMYLSYVGRAKSQWKYMVYAMIAYAVVFGIRYGVGVDYFSYLHNYNAYTTTTGHWGVSQSFEPGFGFITEALATCNAHYSIYFGVVAFLQMLFTFLAFKDQPKLYPYLIFSFMAGAYWLTYSNGLRQIMALSIWIWAIKFMAEKKVWKFYLSIAFACTMHTSAVLLVVFYPIFHWKQEWFRDIRIQLALLVLSLVLMKLDVIQNVMQNLDTVIAMTRYDDYLQDDYAKLMHSEVKLGLGFFITLLTIILLIINSNKTKDFFKSKYLDITYDLFMIGVALKYIFVNSMLFARVNYYFINLLMVVAAFSMHYAHRRNKALFYTLLMLIIFIFLATVLNGLDNTATYVFFWQKDLYHLKYSF